ncbi:hypothetical protein A6A03_17025 [Chloroflexus islandicus]|uniref:Uncharacterized protein n=1 Tax=Chloroflexus islandicus TaxID=1707952 RepID=A0A178M6D6_9CHLR|nr:hypothetical protein [Chloroflexus islandicus]OAN44321.1 hypothetical protein A6A03_17025 [Chloroflexus islandicus]
MIVRRLRLTVLLSLVAVCLLAAQITSFRVAMAQPTVSLELGTPFAGQYVVGQWLPLRVTLRNQGLSAAMVTVTATPADSTIQYARTLRLAAQTQQSLWLYVFLAQPARAVFVTLAIDGLIVDRQEVALLLRPVERMRAVVGTSPVTSDLFAAGSLRVANLPDHHLGLSNLSVLALFELDGPLLAAQQTALLAWVYNGGHLIIGGGPAAIALQAALPPALQAATITGAAVIDREPVVTLGKSSLNTPLLGVKLAPVTGAQYRGDPAAPAWVEYAVGRGRVTQLAFAPEALAAWAGREQFWTALAQPVLFVATPAGASAQITPWQLQMLTPALDALPQIAIPAFAQGLTALTWYALAMVLLALGFWRWRRFAPAMSLLLVALISAGVGLWWANANAAPAYSALRMTLIEVIDSERAQAQTISVMLSAMPRTETMVFTNPVIARPFIIAGSDGSPGGGSESLAQMTTQLERQLAPWQTQALWTTALIPAPVVRSTLVVDQGRLRVDMQNDSQYTLRDVFVVYGDQLLFFGTLRPGARSVARWPVLFTPAAAGLSLGQLVIKDLQENGLLIDGDMEKAAQIRAALADAAVAALPTRFDPGPFVLAWLDRDPTVPVQPSIGSVETLLVMRPPIRGQGELSLPVGWLRLDPAGSEASPCLNGQGVQLSGEIAEIRLRLPPDLSSLRASAIQVRLSPAGATSNVNLALRAYNWVTGAWDAVAFNPLSTMTMTDAEPYLRFGEVRLRLSGGLDRLGCVVATGGVQGVLP